MLSKTSRIPGFYKLPIEERLKIVAEYAGLTQDEIELLKKTGNLDLSIADRMIENVIGTMAYPFAIAVNFLINNRDYLIPMVIEEPSVVAAASNAAKWARAKGGIFTSSTGPIMIGQIQLTRVKDPWGAKMKILEHKNDLIRIANEQDPTLVNLGGGAKDIEVRVIDTAKGPMVITHLIVDVRDAMGANAVNTMAEAVAPYIEDLTNGKVFLRIITNLADKRLVRARTVIDKNEIGGEEVVDGIVEAWAFAAADPYRAATHNKGIMNGIIAVALATAQDHRALEAGAHAYAARFGHYTSLSTWEKNENGDLVGTLEMPMAVGLVGGAVKTHPIARIAIKILGIKTANELGEIMAAVGLIQNLAALKALVTEGIQKGHMKLHARNIAIMAGATPDILDKVVEIMINEGKIRFDRAKEIVEQLKKH
ncbi:MAG: hydroxymethylglutaryl-CoA reductase, degradative [archaeon YNP-LCB-003-016]|jgi:hydroxymethylglutaryl-CoA reductase|uniref:hydroxymethylglutaryl-CoA reductase, degradative n=1 Tax=Candidatus Culexarchaeum yellowstonense TaxID=2928963 RepID=UPI0026EEA213|nr:hydroxymethylglutaryl-CoA reductase, degradative [Candidatus Culexarchaeum yellowstonense]MCR6692647.1 hydroxymethylglutaryl-CoA reductase, degradative [Candidatus Culexarchaeum yellowstonense]